MTTRENSRRIYPWRGCASSPLHTTNWTVDIHPKAKETKEPPEVDNYVHSHIVHYEIKQYLLSKLLKNFKKVGEAAVEK